MEDLIFIGITLLFFALSFLLIQFFDSLNHNNHNNGQSL